MTLVRLLIGNKVALSCLLMVCFFPNASHALSCFGYAESQARCLDTYTLQWCDEEDLKEMTCPAGEICAEHARFDGSVGCIPRELTGCAKVPAEGLCASPLTVTWCDRGVVVTETCRAEERCTYNVMLGQYECSSGGVAAESAYFDAADMDEPRRASDASIGLSAETIDEDIGPRGSDVVEGGRDTVNDVMVAMPRATAAEGSFSTSADHAETGCYATHRGHALAWPMALLTLLLGWHQRAGSASGVRPAP